MKISESLAENIEYAEKMFPIGKSFDIITRRLILGGTECFFIGINGFCDLELIQKIFANLQNPGFIKDAVGKSYEDLIKGKIGYAQMSLSNDWTEIQKNVLSGPCVLFFDGSKQALIIDTRSYPSRSVEEPDTEKVVRGAKDGFVETLLTNTNMIRRRIRSGKLTFEILSVGSESQSDVALAYMDGLCDKELLLSIKNKIKSLNVTALTMGSKSMEELILPRKWYHPLPAFFWTERPDVACSYLTEGYILLMVDTTPSVLVLPSNIFQFTQSPEDYYKSMIMGNYIRLGRFLCIILSLLLMPTFLLFAIDPALLPSDYTVLPTGPLDPMQIFLYVLVAELMLDLFKYSSSHSPGGFSGSLAIVGGLLVGDVAVKLHWASTEVIFYAAATVLVSLSISSLELADAIRIYRMFLIFCTGFFSIWGYCIGLGLIVLSIVTTPSFGKKSYFWPLVPFDKKALLSLLFRYPTVKAQPIAPSDPGSKTSHS